MKFHMLYLIVILIFMTSCSKGEIGMGNDQQNPVTIDDLNKLADSKIYFGHMSVGHDILEGVKDILKEKQYNKLTVIDVSSANADTNGMIIHSLIGENKMPFVKIKAFKDIVTGNVGDRVDIAFFKFCYVDISPDTDIKMVFDSYHKTVKELHDKYPKLTIVHVTVPITQVQTGFKAEIKKLIGNPIGGYEDNVRRIQFNEMLIKEYEGREPVFDLAKLESTYPNGERSNFIYKGRKYSSLIPSYSYDGRHLNQMGRKAIASELLRFLAHTIQ